MKTKRIILALAVASSLASCTTNDPVGQNSNFPADGIIRVKTGVDVPVSRDFGQNVDNLSKFNLYVSCPTDEKYSYSAYMKEDQPDKWNSYSAENGGVTPLVMKWKDKTTNINVTALGIYKKCVPLFDFVRKTKYSVLTKQIHDDSIKISDILYMNKKPIDPQQNLNEQGQIGVQLLHRLSKFKITLNLFAEFNTMVPPVSKASDIEYVAVNGLKTIFLWNASKDDEFSFDIGSKVNPSSIITLNTVFNKSANPLEKTTAIYECVAVPQYVAPDTFYISFAINGQPYYVNFKGAMTFVRGLEYSISLDVGKDIIIISGFTATPWEDGKVKPEYIVK